MPIVLLERIPLPSLRSYSAISVCLLAISIFYSHQVVQNFHDNLIPNLKSIETSNEKSDDQKMSLKYASQPSEFLNEKDYNRNSSPADFLSLIFNSTEDNFSVKHENLSLKSAENQRFIENKESISIFDVLITETWCIWTLINMAYCCFILVGRFIQKIIFGELRVSEQHHIKDKFWNFVFYKFIFIFGVINVQNMDEVLYWCFWFSVLCALHLLAQLCTDRFEYLSFSPTTPPWTHAKVILLLLTIQGICSLLFVICGLVGYYVGLNIFAFMAAECALLSMRTVYVILRYAVHLWDLNHTGVWENRSFYEYYTGLVFELSTLGLDFVHHLHMLLWGNIFLSMASLVICMQLRFIFYELKRRVRRHKNYLHVVRSIEEKFPMASNEEINKNNDDCAICWDKMEAARKLSCGHLFHNACLRSWLEQDTSCPTCRTSFATQEPPTAGGHPVPAAAHMPDLPAETANVGPIQPNQNHGTTNHSFYFDASRYISWLPTFSVEVTHTQLGGHRVANTPQTSQFDNMVRQVQMVFPNVPSHVILEDLRVTHSVEATIENILEGVISIPNNNMNISGDESLSHGQSETSLSNQSNLRTNELLMMNSDSENTAGTSETDSNALLVDSISESDESSAMQSNRFSKSPGERENMLQMRKKLILEQARRRYTMKSKEAGQSSPSAISAGPSNADSNQSRSELAFHAAQRRLNHPQSPSLD